MKTRLKKRFTKRIKLIVVLSLMSIPGYGQWHESTSTTFGYLQEVEFPAANAAYIAGFHSVYKSTDGGVSWTTVLDAGPFAYLTNLNFIDANTGFVSLYGTIYRTLDGGVSWTPISGNHGQPIKVTGQKLYASYVSNDTTYVIKSDDYGTSWKKIFKHYEQNAAPYLFDFIDQSKAYLINPNELEEVYYTYDGFISLDTISILNGPITPQAKYDFIDLDRGYLYGSGGSQSHPTRTWGTGERYFSIDLDGFGVLPVLDLDFNTSYIYAGSLYGKIFYSQDYGQTWTEQSPPTSDPIYSITFLNNNNGIAVSGNEIFYTNNGGMGLQEHNTIEKNLIVYPNPAKNIIYLKNPENFPIQKIHILDIQGKLVKEYPGNAQQLDVADLMPGFYFLQMHTDNGKTTKKFLIK